MLLHRTQCKRQFEQELEHGNKADTIHIRTYQSIEHDILDNLQEPDLSQYGFIVSDNFIILK